MIITWSVHFDIFFSATGKSSLFSRFTQESQSVSFFPSQLNRILHSGAHRCVPFCARPFLAIPSSDLLTNRVSSPGQVNLPCLDCHPANDSWRFPAIALPLDFQGAFTPRQPSWQRSSPRPLISWCSMMAESIGL